MRKLILLTTLVCLSILGCMDDPTGNLAVFVTDGTQLPAEEVRLSLSTGGDERMTDENGVATFTSLEPGEYTVMADHPEFGTVSGTETVVEDRTVQLNLMLPGQRNTRPFVRVRFPRTDFLHTQILGDSLGISFVASDGTDEELTLTVVSNRDGELLNTTIPSRPGESMVKVLISSLGDHTVTVMATDAGGESDEGTFELEMVPPSTIPFLYPLEVGPEGVILKWSQNKQADFQEYYLLRQRAFDPDPQNIGVIFDASDTMFVDSRQPLTEPAKYSLYTQAFSVNGDTSNVRSYEPAGRFLDCPINVRDASINSTRRELYLTGGEDLLIYDLDTDELLAEIPSGGLSGIVATSVHNDTIFFTDRTTGIINVVAPDTREIVRTYFAGNFLRTDSEAEMIVLSENRLAISQANSDGVQIIASSNGRSIKQLASDRFYRSLVAEPGGASFYALNTGRRKLMYCSAAPGEDFLIERTFDLPDGGFGLLSLSSSANRLFLQKQSYSLPDLTPEITFPDIISAVSEDGAFVAGDTGIYDGRSGSRISQLPGGFNIRNALFDVQGNQFVLSFLRRNGTTSYYFVPVGN